MAPVAPVSMTMLQMVPRALTLNPATSSPKNSKTTPRPPRTPYLLSSSRMMSLASTDGWSAPVSSTPITRGHGMAAP